MDDTEAPDYGHWIAAKDFDAADWFGFIYRIIDTTNGREYIGKKQFGQVRRKTVKGKTRKKIVKSESKWRTYTSSSAHVNEAIQEKGAEHFIFLIESLHKTKAGLFYAEIEAQVNEDVLRARLPNGERKFYNGMVGNVKFIPPVDTPEEAEYRVARTERIFKPSKYLTEELVEKYRIGTRNA